MASQMVTSETANGGDEPFGSDEVPFGSDEVPLGSDEVPLGSVVVPFGSVVVPLGSVVRRMCGGCAPNRPLPAAEFRLKTGGVTPSVKSANVHESQSTGVAP